MADRALLVGINTYPGCPLAGCVDDVNFFAHDVLVGALKYSPADIRLITDNRATTQEIWARLNWLTAGLKAGDRAMFYFSGHGAQNAGRDTSGEIDGLNNVICPYDFDWSEEKMITDHQFKAFFAKIPPGVKFNWVSDSCHSGDLTKDLFRTGGRYQRAKTMPVPADIRWRINAAIHKNFSPAPRALIQGVLDVGFISGCTRSQTSADTEVNGVPCGALSYYLRKNLLAPDGLKITLAELVQRVIKDLVDNGYTQTPQAEGARIHVPFQS
jgi:hypothetical protein